MVIGEQIVWCRRSKLGHEGTSFRLDSMGATLALTGTGGRNAGYLVGWGRAEIFLKFLLGAAGFGGLIVTPVRDAGCSSHGRVKRGDTPLQFEVPPQDSTWDLMVPAVAELDARSWRLPSLPRLLRPLARDALA